MGIKNVKTGKLLYHLTAIDNLDSIFKNGLLSRRFILENNVGFCDVADPNIIDERRRLGLDSYIPFHFHPYTAFDVAVKNNGDARRMVYICIDRSFARQNDFLILPQHPLAGNQCRLFPYDEGFNRIDWETMMETGRKDRYAKEVKMAESLTEKRIPVDHFSCLYAASNETKEEIEEKLRAYSISFPPPYVNVQQVWFDSYESIL